MKEEGSFVLKDMKTKAEEEALANRPPPPPPPPIPPPPEKKLDDYDLTGFSGAALFIFNGVITGIKGAHMIESGLLTGKDSSDICYCHSIVLMTYLPEIFPCFRICKLLSSTQG